MLPNERRYMLNEEVQYNFGFMIDELRNTRTILTQTIVSIAKIDDQLLGTILNNKARSQFITENKFYLISGAESENGDSNCNKDNMIFKTGRWEFKTNGSQCTNIQSVESIDILKPLNLWPYGVKKETFNQTDVNLDGWTAMIKEHKKLNEELKTIKNIQQIQEQLEISRYLIGSSALTIFMTIQSIG